jgi:hypothetical protein
MQAAPKAPVQEFVIKNKSTGVSWMVLSDSEAYRRCKAAPSEYEISPVPAVVAKPEPKKPEKSG